MEMRIFNCVTIPFKFVAVVFYFNSDKFGTFFVVGRNYDYD